LTTFFQLYHFLINYFRLTLINREYERANGSIKVKSVIFDSICLLIKLFLFCTKEPLKVRYI